MGRGDFAVGQPIEKRPATNEMAEPALLVHPRRNVDGEIRTVLALGKRACNFKPVHHTHGAIEPAALRLRIGV